jgi:hypothetical protein
MRLRGAFTAILLAAVAAACSGGPAATQGGNGNGNPTPAPQQPTPAPQQPTPDGNGGGGNPDFTYGKVTFEVSGPIQTSDEYGFVPVASLFGGPAGTSLNFTNNVESGGSLLTIVQTPEGTVIVQFVGAAGTIPASTCETSNWNIGTTNASGTFDCTAEFSMMPSGAAVQGGRITGSFTASAT